MSRDPGTGEGQKCMGKGVIRVRTLAFFYNTKKASQLQMLAGSGMHCNCSGEAACTVVVGVTGLLEFYNACA